MRIAFYGSSLLSAYWNGAATYYRGILRALAALGYDITFYEPDVYDRQAHRDMEPPHWCRVVVYDGTVEALKDAAARAGAADIVVKTSGVGFADDALLRHVLDAARPGAVRIFWDVDAPATIAELNGDRDHPMHGELSRIDLVLTYGGGDPVVEAYRALGASRCVPVYNAVDPDIHHPVAPEPRFAADLALLANRLPDREARVDDFFFDAAAKSSAQRFLLGGAGWDDKAMPDNVGYVGHVPTRDHNAFNATPKAVLNVNRTSMAENGFSPATRVFEAAGAAACMISDGWPGLDRFLAPGREVLVARDGADVAGILNELTPETARDIGRLARRRVLGEHTYLHRAAEVDRILCPLLAARNSEAAE